MRDWSSDVCSSDLAKSEGEKRRRKAKAKSEGEKRRRKAKGKKGKAKSKGEKRRREAKAKSEGEKRKRETKATNESEKRKGRGGPPLGELPQEEKDESEKPKRTGMAPP